MNFKLIPIFFCFLLSAETVGQNAKTQSWIFLNFDYKISKKNLIAIQFWDRNYYNSTYNRHLYFVNVAFNHAHSERTHYLFGIINQFDIREDKSNIAQDLTKDQYTLSSWQGISYDFLYIGKAKFGLLTRVEERFNFNDFIDFDLRFRERVQLRYPIIKNANFRATAEMIFNIRDDITTQIFYADQLRTFFGVNYKLFKRLKVEGDFGIFYRRNNSLNFDFEVSPYMFFLSVDYILTSKIKSHPYHDKRHY